MAANGRNQESFRFNSAADNAGALGAQGMEAGRGFRRGPGTRDRSRDCAGLDDGPGSMNRGSETTTPQRSRPQVLSGDRACIAQNTVQNRERREKQLRTALMARRVDRPASTFVLKHLKGTRDDGMDIEPFPDCCRMSMTWFSTL